ncbi:hypothetical protein KGY77_08515 [Candidatus Bipolaricaulota bacterium]|nr:hypothetical protein [Candidatus Bipolaricaulota bacterium]
MSALKGRDWKKIDPWWRVHSKRKQEDLKELYQLMQDLKIEWKESNNRFNKDPLSVDWSGESGKIGPLPRG